LSFSIGAGISYPFDPYAFALDAGEERPPCESFVFAFAWSVVVPESPPPDIALSWQTSASGAPEEVARGAGGSADVGCGTLTAVNETDSDVAVLVDWLVGEVQQ
jgi:hypothetical protein